MDHDYLGVKEIAQYLGLRESFVYVLIESGRIPHYRVGRLVRFKKEDIDRWMEEHRQEPDPPAGRLPTSRRRRGRALFNVDRLVKKSIASAKTAVYNKHHGRPDRIRGLGREEDHGAL